MCHWKVIWLSPGRFPIVNYVGLLAKAKEIQSEE
jgi:hypothetical protein